MGMLTFHTLFPGRDYLGVIPSIKSGLPRRPFVFVEAYCVEAGCDCRRVMLIVVAEDTGEQVATINYAFEPPESPFDEFGQCFLDPLNPQSALSEGLLGVFEDLLEHDGSYHDDLVRRYETWKRVVDDPEHPSQPTIRLAATGDGIPRRGQTLPRRALLPDPDSPCACGSGRIYKRCCCN
jgi:hypothetical protein